MQQVLAVLLCAGIFIGGHAEAHAADTKENAILGGFGKTDLQPFVKRLREDGCKYAIFLKEFDNTKVPANCFGLPADQVVFHHYRFDPQRTVARNVTIEFPNYTSEPFDTFARSLTKKYGQPVSAVLPPFGNASRQVIWKTDGMTIRLKGPLHANKGTLEYFSPELEKLAEEDRLAKKRRDHERMESML